MTDMTAFERQLSGEITQLMGPVRQVDDAVIYSRIASAQSPERRFQSAFSVAKFVVAGAILVLCGGFLLSGVLTQPSEESVPPVGASPSAPAQAEPTPTASREHDGTPSITAKMRTPTADQDTTEREADADANPDLLPGVELVTEEVEAGVYRVLRDGVRELGGVGLGASSSHAVAPDGLAIAPDGSVWLDAGSLVRLGDPESFPWAPDLRFGPDGSPWARTGESDTSIGRLEAGGWSELATLDPQTPPMQSTPVPSWDIAADGTVWAGRELGVVARLTASGWQDAPMDPETLGLDLVEPYIEDLKVDADGQVWAALATSESDGAPMVLMRSDGEAWSLVDPLDVGGYSNVDLIDIGSDGTLWVYLTVLKAQRPYLARLVDGEWTVFSTDEGVRRLAWRSETDGLLRAGHRGEVWVRPVVERSPGIYRFDGETWQQYLKGHEAVDMEIAPDGRVWVLTRGGLFVVDLEAVAASG